MSTGRWLRTLKDLALAALRRDAQGVLVERRELALLALDGEARLVTFERDGLVWTTTTVRHTITRNLFVHGRHPRGEVDALGAWLAARGRLGDAYPWAVEIGSNVGAPTLFFVRDLGRRVLAIEPVPANLDLLRRNVAANGMESRVTAVAAAVAREPATLTMLRPPKDGQCEVASAETARRLAADGALERVDVPALPLDRIVAEHGVPPAAVSFAWSDTQGYETGVIASGAALWAAGAPLFVEVWPEGLEAHDGVAAFVAAAEAAFTGYVPSRELLAGGASAAPRPIAGLAAFVAALSRQTDVLLVP